MHNEIKAYLKRKNISVKEFSRQLAPYLDIEWSEPFYQRIYRILEGGEADPHELAAMDEWAVVESNPHKAGAIAFQLRNEVATAKTLHRYLKSGIYNPTQSDRAFARIIRKMEAI